MKQERYTLWQPASAQSGKEHDHDQRPQEDRQLTVVLQVNGQSVVAHPDDTVATALLRAGFTAFARNAKSGLPQAPACLMGVCFGCVCTIDGRPGSQACLEPVRNGLVVTIDEEHP